MSKFIAFAFILAGFGMILTFQNCGQAPQPNTTNASLAPGSQVSVTGVVEKSTLDGCKKLIVSDADGTSKFIPFGVPDTALPEGAHVTVSGSVPNDVYSSCMAGVILRIEKVETH